MPEPPPLPLAPDALAPGDRLETLTEIRRGDTVVFERAGSGVVTLRALSDEEQAAHPGPLFRVDRTPDGQIAFAPL